jgi:hypothetical protein
MNEFSNEKTENTVNILKTKNMNDEFKDNVIIELTFEFTKQNIGYYFVNILQNYQVQQNS